MQSQVTAANDCAGEVQRPGFVYWATLWGLGLAVALGGIAGDWLRPRPDIMPGRDFTNLWAAGRLVLAGDAWWAFEVDIFRLWLGEQFGTPMLQNYSYPPHALLLAAPFALLPYSLALAAWTILGAAFFVYAARPYLPHGFHPLLAIATPAAALNIWNGHYGFVLGALWLIFFKALRTNPSKAGVIAALLTIKPHMGLPILIVSCFRWRVFLIASVTTLALVVLSAILFDPASWVMFLTNTFAAQTSLLTHQGDDPYLLMMPSAFIGFGQGAIGTAAQIVFGLAALALLLRKRDFDPFTWAIGTFLMIPYVFNYDMTVACLGVAIALFSSWAKLAGWERVTLSLAFLSPSLTYVASWFVPIVLLAALVILQRLAAGRRGGEDGRAFAATDADQPRPATLNTQ